MKYLKKYRALMMIFIFPLLAIMCMTIENIIYPDDPQVNSDIQIGVDIKLVPENDDNTQLTFAVLAPKSWNLADNAELFITTTGYTKGDISNEKMVLMPESEIEPTTALPWSTALQSEIGLMGNLGPVEWVVFHTQTTFIITDEDEKLITANVKINLTTGSENIKLFMGYFFCGKNRGLHDEYYEPNAKTKVLTVMGGSNPLLDYTTVSLVSTVPASYGWGDIFSLKFETVAGAVETPLKDAAKVYLYGKVFYADGNDSTVVDVISDKTLMEKVGETTWQKYIYPKDFFNLPDDAVITEAKFHFSNEDQSIIVKQASGDDFVIMETCN
ncbi:DUF4961 domain-containing protein [Sunxiuqinia sp. A32]|uniref:DUF4961 domain-containing protein n=1 Tax=Sunxiuqinia sp. A32 TaxID=3461496 RepID=UPI0040463E10